VDGTLDASFSGDGKRVTNFTPGDDFAWDVTLEADGKIVAAGFAAAASGGKFALARFNADGSLDDTFGGDGGVTTNLSTRHDAATAVAIQSDVRPRSLQRRRDAGQHVRRRRTGYDKPHRGLGHRHRDRNPGRRNDR
jgi:uncharacterized delta-60 repeat protein